MNNSIKLYPLKFTPIIKERIWGGEKLHNILNKDTKNIKCAGESWEISAVKGEVSIVANGKLKGLSLTDIIKIYKDKLLGTSIFNKFGEAFPLLIKFIDAKENLSIQVHPDDNTAKRLHNCAGKTEMWYVMDAEKDASLLSGFSSTIDPKTLMHRINDGSFINCMNCEKVDKGDTFFIPSGRVHAIGKGVMLAEIQQTSDITYRIYDYNRIDKNGLTRELHIKNGIQAIDFKDLDSGKVIYNKQSGENKTLVNSKYFKSDILNIRGTLKCDYNTDCFKILICVDGNAKICFNSYIMDFNLGDTILIPAELDTIEISSLNSNILEISI
ncbi:MAG: mannose-6-phosphate isomerase [Muribaculaceae bacterium]|nr:mannose-6-phosphate isomerase [Muribaculaceae bacterium]